MRILRLVASTTFWMHQRQLVNHALGQNFKLPSAEYELVNHITKNTGAIEVITPRQSRGGQLTNLRQYLDGPLDVVPHRTSGIESIFLGKGGTNHYNPEAIRPLFESNTRLTDHSVFGRVNQRIQLAGFFDMLFAAFGCRLSWPRVS